MMQNGERHGPGEPADREPADAGDLVPASGAPRRRPMFERLGLALVAIVMAALFGAIALAAWSGGELFLALAGGVGCLMTLWVGMLTLFRD
jgi:hypothetical protein